MGSWSAQPGHRVLTCRQAVELVTEHLEGALPDVDRARFEPHLAECDACTAYLAQMRATVGALGHLDQDRWRRQKSTTSAMELLHAMATALVSAATGACPQARHE